MEITAEKRARIEAALKLLEPGNDSHWVMANGRPQVAVVQKLAKTPVRKSELDAVAPHLTRDMLEKQIAEQINARLGGAEGIPATPTNEVEDAVVAAAAVVPPKAKKAPPQDTRPALERPVQEVMASVPLMQAAHREIAERLQQIAREQTALRAEETRLSGLSALVDRQLAIVAPDEGQTLGQQVKAVQARSQRERAKRAERTRAFVGAGTTREAVAKLLDGKAPLDRAMNARRGVIGSRRPTPRTPAGLRG